MITTGKLAITLVALATTAAGCASTAAPTDTATSAPPVANTSLPATLEELPTFLQGNDIPCTGERIQNLGVDGNTFKVVECKVTPNDSYPTMRVGLGDAQGNCKYAAKAKEMASSVTAQPGIATVYNNEIGRQLLVGDGWWVMGEDYTGMLPPEVTLQAVMDALGDAQVTTIGEFCKLQPIPGT